ncbi:MAG: Maf family protein [Sediminibacterium sp.]|nr:Maf family protein [Sediminibacterium sp.]
MLILASESPRRIEMLKNLGFDFEIIPAKIKETVPKKLENDFEKIPLYIAKNKALTVYKKLTQAKQKKALILAADTIVVIDNKILGKPRNKKDAINMLTLLSNHIHYVISGVIIYHKGELYEYVDKTKVKFSKIPIEFIEEYVTEKKPYDKAGSYGVQDCLGQVYIEYINGNYYTILGLPISKFYNDLKNLLANN